MLHAHFHCPKGDLWFFVTIIEGENRCLSLQMHFALRSSNIPSLADDNNILVRWIPIDMSSFELRHTNPASQPHLKVIVRRRDRYSEVGRT